MNIVYIFGLFEDQTNPLFSWLKKNIKSSSHIEWHGVELYSGSSFGSSSAMEEIERIQNIITGVNPEMIVAHSLGAYLVMQLAFDCPVIFLEPSLAVSDIILPNLKQEKGMWLYEDGEYKVQISNAFVESIKHFSSIKESVKNLLLQNVEVCIVGAGRGGYKVAEQYHQAIPGSRYIFLPNASHSFSDDGDRREIAASIEKRLDIMSSRSGCVRTIVR